jgi:hypothetical protein
MRNRKENSAKNSLLGYHLLSIILVRTSCKLWDFLGSHGVGYEGFWDIAPCSLAGVDRRFRPAYWRYRLDGGRSLKRRSAPTRLHGSISQKTLRLREDATRGAHTLFLPSFRDIWLGVVLSWECPLSLIVKSTVCISIKLIGSATLRLFSVSGNTRISECAARWGWSWMTMARAELRFSFGQERHSPVTYSLPWRQQPELSWKPARATLRFVCCLLWPACDCTFTEPMFVSSAQWLVVTVRVDGLRLCRNCVHQRAYCFNPQVIHECG